MSQDRHPAVEYLAALEVKRNATVGFVTSTAIAIVVASFLVSLTSGPVRSVTYTVALAIVLAVALGITITLVLTVRAAVDLSRTSTE